MRNPSCLFLILVAALAATVSACNFDTSGLKAVASNNVNNLNNLNNVSNPVCGNDLLEAGETCDGTDLAGSTCVTRGFDSGTLACATDCLSFDVSGCEGTGPVCGNNLIEGDEVCDGTDLAGQTCITQGFTGGALACAPGCLSFVLTGCEGTGPECGNGIIEGLELCDGANLAGNTCAGLGFASGDLACESDCFGFDTSGCTLCGNGIINGDELCDGANLAGNTCLGLGFAGGDLACEADCAGFDTTACLTQVCGNNHAEGTEVCDGTDLNGKTCLTEGFYGGTLACAGGCSAFNTSGCSLCGNNLIDGSEVCDGSNLDGQSCLTLGCRTAGTLLCNAGCSDFVMLGCYVGHDEDGDGVDDNCDNCPTYGNATQVNADGDQIGNVCESPAGATALSTISVFESMMPSTTSWTTVRGTWTAGADLINGFAGNDTDGNYLHPLALAASNYSVEVNFFYRAAPVDQANWAGVIFGWQTSNGNLSIAYECLYERDLKQLQFWKYITYNNMGWTQLATTNVTTTAVDNTPRKMRAYVVNPAIRCVYSDATGATAEITYSDSYAGSSSFTGKAGYRLYNESASFTSFVYYVQ
ncbi:MAG: hypothetical protein CVU59_08730 [Deltaproteobacteria bacterium HGW-Deltaproteobacteria-17]|nr:MAG: hypothetical protein CVU59_08730 [Deltaproteobacteria bacterium HGW-Deltaproteobacteria-17]